MLKDWLSFSRLERYGIIVLLILVIATALFPTVYKTFFYRNPLVQSDNFYKVDSFFTSLKFKPKAAQIKFSIEAEEAPVPDKPELFAFDPNTVTTSELVRLGLSVKQAKVIERFRAKGGVFRQPSDFAKMYVVDSALYSSLAPYIDIAPINVSRRDTSDNTTQTNTSVAFTPLNLNAVDTIQLATLRGIGRSFARRIVAYRQRLGGYHSVNQLGEVYGFSPELLNDLKPQVWVDSLSIERININLTTYQELRKHPYLNDYQSRAIIYYRETMGSFTELEQVVKNKLLDKETFARIKPYLTVN